MLSREKPVEYLADKDLMPIAKKSSPGAIEHIAIEYFDITHDEIKTFKARHRENIEMLNFEILECWRERNQGMKAWKCQFSQKIQTYFSELMCELCSPHACMWNNKYLYGKNWLFM